jgi:hypothetical protein
LPARRCSRGRWLRAHKRGPLRVSDSWASAPPMLRRTRVEALRAGLRDLGYVEDKNLVIEFRWSSKVEQMQEAAAELARMKVDLIFAVLVDRGRAGPTGDQHDPDRLRDGGTLRGAARSRSSSVTSSTGPWEIGRT